MKRTETYAIGTYNHQPSPAIVPGKDSIVVVDFDVETGSFHLRSRVDGIMNPSYLCTSRDGKTLFAVSEDPEGDGELISFSIGDDASLAERDRTAGPGTSVCHVLMLDDSALLVSSAYGNGKVKIDRLSEQNGFLKRSTSISLEGKGPNPERQECPHAHMALLLPERKSLLVSDLGSDSIWEISLDRPEDRARRIFSTDPGAGPRHMVLDSSRRMLYVVCELIPYIYVLKLDDMDAQLLQRIPTVEFRSQIVEETAPAAIKLHPDGRMLAVSNRGIHSVSLFSIDSDGKLAFRESIDTEGRTPRDIAFSEDGSWLLVANQDSDELTCFGIDRDTGLHNSIKGGHFAIGAPACICRL